MEALVGKCSDAFNLSAWTCASQPGREDPEFPTSR